MFGIQRFASDGDFVTSTGDWYKLDGYDGFGYVPAGITFEASSYDESIQRMDGDSLLYAISGISSATGTSDTVTVIARGAISAITVVDSGTVAALYTLNVSGGDKTALTVIVGGTTYGVNSSGKLFEKQQATPLSANAWYPLYSEQTTYGWLAAASTLAAGKAVSDVTVTGSAASTLTLTISGTDYYVNSSGKLYSLPDFGLMTKADKHRLNWLADNLNNFIVGAHTVSGGIAFTNIRGETVCTLETGTQ